MTHRLSHLLRPSLFAALLAALAFSCGKPADVQRSELEEQKYRWVIDYKEAFPEKTQDTTELRRRLEYFNGTGNKIGQLMMLRVLGNEARASSQFRAAIEYHTEGLRLAHELNDTVNITVVMNDLATNFRRIGAFDEAAPYHYLALQIAEEYRGPDTLMIERNIAAAYNGIGSIARAMNEYDEALRVYEEALKLERSHDNWRGIAINEANIGAVHFERQQYDKAEEYYRSSLENNIRAKLPMGIALCRLNIGDIYEVQGRPDDALEEYRQAYDELAGSSDKWHWLDACFQMANIHLREGRFTEAAGYLEEGLRTAREINSMKHLFRAYELYATYHYELGNYRRAADDMRATQAYADTMRHNLEVDRMLESRVKYETERYSQQIEDLDRINHEQQVRSQSRTLWLLGILLILSVVVAVLLYLRRLGRRQAAEVKKLERMRSNFFTNITHELRTPLTLILGHSRLLLKKYEEREETDPAVVEQLEGIHRNGNALLKLVNDLLEFARSESGKSKLKWRRGDMAVLLRSVAEPYERAAHSGDITLSVVSDTDEPVMSYAPEAVKKVFGNLLSNAIRHTPQGGRIEMFLRLDPQGKRCVVTVRDNGEGISPENLPRIFELYYTSNTDGMGSGIGLALTRQLVEEMGGTIAVKSEPGRGTEFTVTLPVEPTDIPEEEVSEAPESIPQGCMKVSEAPERATQGCMRVSEVSESASQGCMKVSEAPESATQGCAEVSEVPERASQGCAEVSEAPESDDKPVVLVVEDNRDVAQYISMVLGERYVMLHALNGIEGFEMAEEHVPDIILTDVMMPGRDGYELTADIRASVAVSHIPIVMLTAKATDDDRIEGIRTGADAYLSKPFNEEELLAIIDQLLKSRAKLMEVYSGALLEGVFAGTDAVADDKDDQNKDFISRLSATISKHIDDEEWFPDGLATEMCLSRSQLYRKVKAMTGVTISAFVMDMRLRRAKLLLSQGGQSVKEVAFACGFSNLGYFSRSFKTAFGCTPSQFMKTPEPQSEEE